MSMFTITESGSEAGGSDGGDEEPAFGGPKPMLPYSSMFIFGPTNP